MSYTEKFKFISIPNEFSICTVYLKTKEGILDCEKIGYKLNEEIEVTVGLGETEIAKYIDETIMKLTIDDKVSKSFVLNDNINLDVSIHLLDFKEARHIYELNVEDMLARAKKLKEAGSNSYKYNEVKTAFYLFGRSFKYLKICEVEIKTEGEYETNSMHPQNHRPDYSSISEEINNFKQSCLLNLALCQSHGNNQKGILNNTTQVLEADERNLKALYRRGLSYMATNEHQLAISDFTAALSLQPSNKAIFKSLQEAKEHLRNDTNLLKHRLKGLFN